MTAVYLVCAGLCVIACLGLTFAIGADWENFRPAWRPVLVAGAVEHGALLYLCLWLAKEGISVGYASIVLAISVAGVALSSVHALVVAWRTGELTPPPGSDREQSR